MAREDAELQHDVAGDREVLKLLQGVSRYTMFGENSTEKNF